jgi:hypothetical protein
MAPFPYLASSLLPLSTSRAEPCSMHGFIGLGEALALGQGVFGTARLERNGQLPLWLKMA